MRFVGVNGKKQKTEIIQVNSTEYLRIVDLMINQGGVLLFRSGSVVRIARQPIGVCMQNNNLGVAMKLGMRRLASGVCILSAQTAEGEMFAMTVSSVTSVSDNPASLLVCINKLVSQHSYLSTPGTRFAINALNSNQQDLSNLCAGREQGRDRFSLGSWQQDEYSVPYLTDAQAVFFCEADKVMEYGTHHIVVGKIHQVLVGEDDVNPLLYVDGGYGYLARSKE